MTASASHLRLAEAIALGILEKKGEDWWEFNAIHDDRTCDTCDQYDGTLWTTGQAKTFFSYAMFTPMLIYPNVHPHCRCAMALVTERQIVLVDLPEPAIELPSPPEPAPAPPIQPSLLTPADVARVQQAIKIRHFTALQPTDYGLPKGLGESLLKKDEKIRK